MWQPVDSTLADSVEVVRLGRAQGAIFPAGYEWGAPTERRFTPSPELVRRIEPAIREQYRGARVAFIERQLNDSTMYTPPLSEDERREHFAEHMRWIDREAKRVPGFDRQYLGYYGSDGERMLLIKFIDFSEDPHGFRPHLAESWIEGWHGWFETNVRHMRFDVDQNRLSVY